MKRIQPNLKQIKNLPDTVHIGKIQTGEAIYRVIPDVAPSRSETFSYLVYLNEKMEILDVDVLEYRESYGYEIDYSFFRKQFRGKKKPDEITYRGTIQNISGATISVRSITYEVHDLLSIISELEIK